MYQINSTDIDLVRPLGLLSLCLCMLLIVTPGRGQEPKSGPPVEPQTNLEKLDISALIAAGDRNGAEMHQRLLEFTYIQKRISREIGPNRKTIELVREYEAYPTRANGGHRHILSLIKKDGVPVSPDQLERNRRLAAGQMERAERGESDPVDSSYPADSPKYVTAGIGIGAGGEGVWLGVSQFLRQCRFETPRHEQIDDRRMIGLAFHSCRGNLNDPRVKYLEKLAGIVWIDATDKVVVRLEAWPISDSEKRQDLFASRPAGEIIVYEQQHIPGGIWVPRRIRLNGIGHAKLFNGVDKDLTFEFLEYRHFSTEIKEAEIVDPKKKPLN